MTFVRFVVNGKFSRDDASMSQIDRTVVSAPSITSSSHPMFGRGGYAKLNSATASLISNARATAETLGSWMAGNCRSLTLLVSAPS